MDTQKILELSTVIEKAEKRAIEFAIRYMRSHVFEDEEVTSKNENESERIIQECIDAYSNIMGASK